MLAQFLILLCFLSFNSIYFLFFFWVVEMDSAVLAHFMLGEKLQKMGMLGCLLCIVGSTMIVLHAPQEKSLSSVLEIWQLAIQPGVLLLRFHYLFLHYKNWLYVSLLNFNFN